MFTGRFKVTVAVVAGVLVAGALGANQLQLQKQVTNLSNRPLPVVTVVATPTVEPTATPTATLRFVPRVSTPRVTSAVK